MSFPDSLFQTRDEAMRALNQISEIVSRQIVPAKQVNTLTTYMGSHTSPDYPTGIIY
jgi:hypothetical protein